MHSKTNGTLILLSTFNLTLGIRYCRHDYYRSLRCERIRHLLLSQGTARELFRRGTIFAVVGEPFNQSIALYSSTDAMHVPKRNSPPCIFVHYVCSHVHTGCCLHPRISSCRFQCAAGRFHFVLQGSLLGRCGLSSRHWSVTHQQRNLVSSPHQSRFRAHAPGCIIQEIWKGRRGLGFNFLLHFIPLPPCR